ncbi:MAG: ASPIC/UnbV domain-containing protein [Planctomycetota bacterium]
MASKKDGPEGIPAFLGEHLALLKKNYSFSGYERDKVWLNRKGKSFTDISGASAADSISDGRAAVFVDFDDDGDTDILLRAMHGRSLFLFRNEVGQMANWLRVELKGTRSGTDAFGSVVRVKSAHGIQTKVKQGGGRYCAQSDPRLLFGLGKKTDVEWVEVTWPDGTKQKIEGARAGQTLRIEQK